MLKLLTGLTKAAVGLVVETPIAVVADAVTLGGTLMEKERDTPFTAEALKKVVENVQDATSPED